MKKAKKVKTKKAKTKKTAKKMRAGKVGKSAKKTTVRKKGAKKKPAKKLMPRKASVRGAEALAVGAPDHRCKRTLERGICLKFTFNPKSGKFDQPVGGKLVPCSECQHFF